MKPTDITDALNGVDPGFVKESEPEPAKRKSRNGKIAARIAALAAALAVIIAAGLFLSPHTVKDPGPSVPTTEAARTNDQNDASSAAAQPDDPTGASVTAAQPEQDGEAAALLRSLTAYAAEYPAQTPYPLEGDFAEHSALEAWNNAERQRRSYFGAGASLSPFFARSLPAFLGGREGDNAVCSPLNIYFALAMLAEISDGDTRAQVLSLLGSPDVETLRGQANRVFNANYRNDGSTYCILADSLWLNDTIDFNSDTLRTLAENYYASTYRGRPGTETFDDAIHAWLNSQTGGLLRDFVSGIKTDPRDVLSLYTTAYFGDKWMAEFQADATKAGVFHSPAGDTDADFMNATDLWGTYYWGERFGAVKKELQQRGTVWFLLPDEGVSPEDLLADKEALRFLFTQNKDAWPNVKSLRVNLSLPKFDVSSYRSLKDGLEELGVTDCFTEKADFTPLTDKDTVFVSEVRHGARVIADEQGVTAAAYTEMILSGASMPPEDEMDFVLDRPFLFAVFSDDSMPLFVGIVNQP